MRTILVLAALVSLSTPVLAQTQRLPRTSPAEQQARDLNQSMQGQNRSLNNQQQSQFELNQLRQELRRQETFPPMIAPGPRVCAPGQVVC
jgi:hypothetical protein